MCSRRHIKSIWLEWALDYMFIGIDAFEHTVQYWKGGKHAFSYTTLAYAAAAGLEILRLPAAKTANKRIYMSPQEASQHQIVAELEKQQGVEYTSLPFEAESALAEAREIVAADHMSFATVPATVLLPEYQANFVTAGKLPLLERLNGVKLPELTVENVVTRN
ncbi:hypothetical protein LTR08_004101 [Meristemomyces frigidus]|nr:hypothetical protein LTR08_004101 [Meristemomyces frigidus]